MTAPPSRKGVWLVALGVFVLAFAVRYVWLWKVQSPLDTVYSDMQGYVDRAEQILQHRTLADPRVLTMFPPGTHAILALEFYTLGRNSRNAIAIAHAIVGALPAPCLALLTPKLVPRLWASALVGTLVALWYPQASFVSYFSTEIWFSAAVALHALLTVQDWKRPVGRLSTGIAAAIAFVVRPQFELTLVIDVGARWLYGLWRRGPAAIPWRRPALLVRNRAVRSFAWFALPLVIAVSITSTRFHRLTGHWGVISESCINRLWADTDVCQLTSTWKTPIGGETWSYWFSPPSKPAVKPSDTVHFDGYIADPIEVNRIRKERLKTVSMREYVRRKLWNVSLLVAGNLPWPESNYKEPPWRLKLQKSYAAALLFVVLPLAVPGLLLGRFNRTKLILSANLVTVVVAAAWFFGEARYNLPYAPFALLLAVNGLYELFGLVARFVRRQRARSQAGAPAMML